MVRFDPDDLPSAATLPDSDETPVDNELQELIPSLLKMVLALVWSGRQDWFFGIDMGVYIHPDEPPLVPDGFLSLGVPRIVSENLRLSYVLWEESQVVPQFVLEVVSKTYRGEYDTKMAEYAQLGFLYYAIYDPTPKYRRRLKRRPDALEIYLLVDGAYLRQTPEPVWMPEIGLALGRKRGSHQNIEREWLYWYNQEGQPYLTPEERIEQEQFARGQVTDALEQLKARLRTRGIDPDSLI